MNLSAGPNAQDKCDTFARHTLPSKPPTRLEVIERVLRRLLQRLELDPEQLLLLLWRVLDVVRRLGRVILRVSCGDVGVVFACRVH